jgi:F-type H+-transporting ATPase subunit b
MKRTGWIGLAMVLTVACVIFAAAADAPAVEHGGAHTEGAHAAPIRDLLFPAINFGVYLFIIARFVVPAMRDYLRQRRSQAVEAASQASEALAHAERVVAANKERLAALASEAESIREDLVTIATRQGARLVTEAEESGARRLADARLMAEQERRRALDGIRSEIATAAVTLAEQKIRTALTPGDQRLFVERFLQDAGAR